MPFPGSFLGFLVLFPWISVSFFLFYHPVYCFQPFTNYLRAPLAFVNHRFRFELIVELSLFLRWRTRLKVVPSRILWGVVRTPVVQRGSKVGLNDRIEVTVFQIVLFMYRILVLQGPRCSRFTAIFYLTRSSGNPESP